MLLANLKLIFIFLIKPISTYHRYNQYLPSFCHIHDTYIHIYDLYVTHTHICPLSAMFNLFFLSVFYSFLGVYLQVSRKTCPSGLMNTLAHSRHHPVSRTPVTSTCPLLPAALLLPEQLTWTSTSAPRGEHPGSAGPEASASARPPPAPHSRGLRAPLVLLGCLTSSPPFLRGTLPPN